jgi:hypothetical protein
MASVDVHPRTRAVDGSENARTARRAPAAGLLSLRLRPERVPVPTSISASKDTENVRRAAAYSS